MALTIAQLAAALRLGDGQNAPAEPVNGILTRQLSAATDLIDKRTADVPDNVKDEALIRICAYWFDQPQTAPLEQYMAAWRSSGASSLLAPWTVRRTGITESE